MLPRTRSNASYRPLPGRPALDRVEQPLPDEPIERTVERARIEADASGGAPLDREHDVVAVALPLSRGQQDLEGDRRQREKSLGLGFGVAWHGYLLLANIRRDTAWRNRQRAGPGSLAFGVTPSAFARQARQAGRARPPRLCNQTSPVLREL
jgi:hypothetical protein